jgi:excisionase family DNA binding protein
MIQGYTTTAEASQRVGLSDSQIRRLLESGTVKGVKPGRDWLVEIASLDHYIANRPKRGGKGMRVRDVQPNE